MALRQTKKISELPALSPASLDTTFVVGISGSTTYKISINNLTSSLDTTFATDLVTNALSSSLNSKLSTSSFNSYTQSFTASVASGTISGSSQLTSSFDTRYTLSGSIPNIPTGSFATTGSNIFTGNITMISGSNLILRGPDDDGFSGSGDIIWQDGNGNEMARLWKSADNNRLTVSFTGSHNSYVFGTLIHSLNLKEFGDDHFITTSSFNSYTASQSTSSLVDRLNTIESVSASWITESETGSFLTSLSGAISSSSQLTSSYDTRYTLSGSILSSFSQSVDSRLDILENEISSSVSYAYITYITEPEVPNDDVNRFLKPDGNISGSISYNQSTGYFTLLAGKTYKLRAVVNMSGGSNSGFEPLWNLQWKDTTNDVYIGIQSKFRLNVPNEAYAIITPNTNILVGLSSLANTENSHPYIIKNSTFFFIEEIALGIVEGITGSTDFTQIINKPTLISGSSQLTSSLDTRYLNTGGDGVISGSAQLPSGLISGSTQLTTAFPSKTTGDWSVPAGASTQSFTVEQGASYTMWVNGNIPNGIITWNATVTTSNTNVPVVGSQYGWYYTAGNALVLTAMPDQIIGTTNTLISSPASYAPNTSNVFKFGITNNSGTTQTINYGYIKLS